LRQTARWRARALLGLLALLPGAPARAADPADSEVDVPVIKPRLGDQGEGKIIRKIEVRSAEPVWDVTLVPLGVKEGDEFSPGLGRRAARELSSTGSVAEVTVETFPEGDGVLLRLVAMPQRTVRSVRVQSDLDVGDVLKAAGIEAGRAVTPPVLRAAEQALAARARARGYPEASARVTVRATDAPLAVVVVVELTAGSPRRLRAVRTEVHATAMPPGLRDLVRGYRVRPGDLLDEDQLRERDLDLRNRLQAGGFHQATVSHRVYEAGGSWYALLSVVPGPLFRLRFEGNIQLDGDQLEDVIDFEHDSDRSVSRAAQKIREEYQRLGFLDVEVSGQERGGHGDPIHDLAFTIRENTRARVAARRYPCLPTPGADDVPRGPRELNQEIDSFLEEELPGATLFGAISPRIIDQTFGPQGPTGARATPLDLDPRRVFVADVYDRALKHLRDVYRSEGYLAASVGPVQLVRRRSSTASPPTSRPSPPS